MKEPKRLFRELYCSFQPTSTSQRSGGTRREQSPESSPSVGPLQELEVWMIFDLGTLTETRVLYTGASCIWLCIGAREEERKRGEKGECVKICS